MVVEEEKGMEVLYCIYGGRGSMFNHSDLNSTALLADFYELMLPDFYLFYETKFQFRRNNELTSCHVHHHGYGCVKMDKAGV